MTIRELTEQQERETLSPRACLAEQSRGRLADVEPCPMRTCFQRDIDRIVHCKSFRRLKHKTQVFLQPEGDHYRTRMTHTLEVSRIARTMARGLRLNEDLTEAASLGHDLGHTPFGHAGERALSRVVEGGFRHYEQSVRVVEKLEKHGKGLNLTKEVRNGIERHTGGEWAYTLEGRIVRVSDRIAYINHDIEDAVRAGILTENDIPLDRREKLGFTKSERINTLVKSVVEASGDDILMPPDIAEKYDALHKFLFASVYTNPVAKGEESKVGDLIKWLYEYYVAHTEKIPSEYAFIVESEGAERAATDHIAGMTDRYAEFAFEELFIPHSWKA